MRTYIFTSTEIEEIKKILGTPPVARNLHQRQILFHCKESMRRLEHDFNLYLRVLAEVMDKPVSVVLEYGGEIREETVYNAEGPESGATLSRVLLNLSDESIEGRGDLL